MNSIDIVYVTDHNYAFITAVSLHSLIKAGNCNTEYKVHILTDDTIKSGDKRLYDLLMEQYHNLQVIFHHIDISTFSSFVREKTYVNKATLYRLTLPELLPDVNKCIYLDADTLVWEDVDKLFTIDMDAFFIAGVWDMGIDSLEYRLEELPEMDTYVNAGVLVFNLKLMRERNLQAQFLDRIGCDYYFNDQDILNICCYPQIKLLPEKYNYFAYRDNFNFNISITHFLSWTGIRPWINLKARYAEQWWKHAELFCDTKWYEKTYEEAKEWYRRGSLRFILGECEKFEKIFIWGTAYEAMRVYRALKINGIKNVEAFIDGKKEKQGILVCGKQVLAPEELKPVTDALIINTAVRTDSIETIEKKTVEMGFKKEQLVRYQKYPEGFYTFMDPIYREEEMQELYMWEYPSGKKLNTMII